MTAESNALNPESTDRPQSDDPDRVGVDTVLSPVYRTAIAWAQIIAVFVLLELALWAPSREIRDYWAVIAAIMIAAALLSDRPSFGQLGFRLPSAGGLGVMLGTALVTIVALLTVTGWAGGAIPANRIWPNTITILGYLIWAFTQEFILQALFFRRFERLYRSSAAVWMASTLFAAVHLPNPFLTTATLCGALFFCEMFRRYRSLYPLAVMHAILGLTIAVIVPDSLLHHMRVGIGYLQYR